VRFEASAASKPRPRGIEGRFSRFGRLAAQLDLDLDSAVAVGDTQLLDRESGDQFTATNVEMRVMSMTSSSVGNSIRELPSSW